jgi:hypothetical protein
MDKRTRTKGQTTIYKRRVWRYHRVNQNLYKGEEQTTQWTKEQGQKDKQRIHVTCINWTPVYYEHISASKRWLILTGFTVLMILVITCHKCSLSTWCLAFWLWEMCVLHQRARHHVDRLHLGQVIYMGNVCTVQYTHFPYKLTCPKCSLSTWCLALWCSTHISHINLPAPSVACPHGAFFDIRILITPLVSSNSS